jgi:hypothetical protein
MAAIYHAHLMHLLSSLSHCFIILCLALHYIHLPRIFAIRCGISFMAMHGLGHSINHCHKWPLGLTWPTVMDPHSRVQFGIYIRHTIVLVVPYMVFEISCNLLVDFILRSLMTCCLSVAHPKDVEYLRMLTQGLQVRMVGLSYREVSILELFIQHWQSMQQLHGECGALTLNWNIFWPSLIEHRLLRQPPLVRTSPPL